MNKLPVPFKFYKTWLKMRKLGKKKILDTILLFSSHTNRIGFWRLIRLVGFFPYQDFELPVHQSSKFKSSKTTGGWKPFDLIRDFYPMLLCKIYPPLSCSKCYTCVHTRLVHILHQVKEPFVPSPVVGGESPRNNEGRQVLQPQIQSYENQDGVK